MLIVWFHVDKIFKVLKESLTELSHLRTQTPLAWKKFQSEYLPTFHSLSIYSIPSEEKKKKEKETERKEGRRGGKVYFTRIITRIYTAF